MMAPIISIKNITEMFALDTIMFTGAVMAHFIKYVDFTIKNFKLNIELDLKDKGALQMR